jgi:hypothetical protein
MTTKQLIVVLLAYLIALIAAVYFTRPTWRRAVGALAGGAFAGLIMFGAIALCNALGWWRVPIPTAPGVLALFYVAGSVSCAPIYLVTWRVALRFGWRGLAVCLIVVAIIGPPRDYMYAVKFPEWMVFAPGVAPILADAAAYVAVVALGHAVMWLVAGPARSDRPRPRRRAGTTETLA